MANKNNGGGQSILRQDASSQPGLNSILIVHMKRNAKHLEADERAQREGEVRRGRRQEEEEQERVAKKSKDKEEKFVAKWRSHLEKWAEMGLENLSALSLPQPEPPSPHPRLSSLFLNLYRYFS